MGLAIIPGKFNEMVRQWGLKFSREVAKAIHQRTPQRGDCPQGDASASGDIWTRWVDHHCRPEALAVAGGRSGGRCTRCSGSAPARPEGGLVLAAQAAQEARLGPARHDHRHAEGAAKKDLKLASEQVASGGLYSLTPCGSLKPRGDAERSTKQGATAVHRATPSPP